MKKSNATPGPPTPATAPQCASPVPSVVRGYATAVLLERALGALANMVRSGGSGRPYSREEICWGSFERNTGAWCPFTEQDAIEAAYQANEASIHLPACFDATVHFSEPHCFQRTPAVGSKPSGFRSVLRGEVTAQPPP